MALQWCVGISVGVTAAWNTCRAVYQAILSQEAGRDHSIQHVPTATMSMLPSCKHAQQNWKSLHKYVRCTRSFYPHNIFKSTCSFHISQVWNLFSKHYQTLCLHVTRMHVVATIFPTRTCFPFAVTSKALLSVGPQLSRPTYETQGGNKPDPQNTLPYTSCHT